jgi:hypothetical protein
LESIYEDPERDEPNVRFFKIDGNELIMERKDPFGFWFIHYKKGQVPEELKSAFTSVAEATKAVYVYLGRKKKILRAET